MLLNHLHVWILFDSNYSDNKSELSEIIVRWELRRTIEDLQALDRQLHTCIYDRFCHTFDWVWSHI